MIHSYHWWTSVVTENLCPYKFRHAAVTINETPCRRLRYTSTPTHMFIKSKINSNPHHWKPLFFPVYALARPLATDQPFDKCKYKSTPGIYFWMSTIHVRALSLVNKIMFAVRVFPQFHVTFYPSLITSNGHGGNIVPTSYWQTMCGFVKVDKCFSCILSNMTHQLHSFLRQINLSLPVIMTQNWSNIQRYQCKNMIPSKHRIRNPHHSSNR